MINDWGMPTLWVFDSGDKLNNGDVASCGGVMKGTGSTFISLTQDLWALLHQVLQESQVTLLSQLEGRVQSETTEGEWKWYEKRMLEMWTFPFVCLWFHYKRVELTINN